MVAPMALFFMNENKTLMPLAIQLNQEPGPENPVSFRNNDETNIPNLWNIMIL